MSWKFVTHAPFYKRKGHRAVVVDEKKLLVVGGTGWTWRQNDVWSTCNEGGERKLLNLVNIARNFFLSQSLVMILVHALPNARKPQSVHHIL